MASNDETEKRGGLMFKIEELNKELLKEGLLNVKELCKIVFNMKCGELEKMSGIVEKMCGIIENLNEENKMLGKRIDELEDDLEERTGDLKDYTDNKNRSLSKFIENLQEELNK